MIRTLRTITVLALFASPVAASAADKCAIATKPETEVGKACAAGGVKEAKKVMKEMTRAAKAKGMKVDCDTCHKDDTKFDLTDNAKADFKKMMDLLGKK